MPWLGSIILLPRNDIDRHDPATVAVQDIVDKVSYDQVRPPSAPIDDAAQENVGLRIPFDIEGSVSVPSRALEFRPAAGPSRLLLLGDSEIVVLKSLVVDYRIAEARSPGTDHLNKRLHRGSAAFLLTSPITCGPGRHGPALPHCTGDA